MWFWIVVIAVVLLLCNKKGGSKSQNNASPVPQNTATRTMPSTNQSSRQKPPTSRNLSGGNNDYAYIFGSMVAALGATGYVQIGGNGTVLFEIGSFGENWDACKINLPQNIYNVVSASYALTDKAVGGTRVMKYKPQGSVICSFASHAKWKEDVDNYFNVFESEIKQGYSDTNAYKKTLTFRREINAETQYAVLWVAK